MKKTKKYDHFLSSAAQIVVIRFYFLCVKRSQDCPDVIERERDAILFIVDANKIGKKSLLTKLGRLFFGPVRHSFSIFFFRGLVEASALLTVFNGTGVPGKPE